MSQNITSAVNLLLREEEKVEEMYGHISTRFLPRLGKFSMRDFMFFFSAPHVLQFQITKV